MSIADELALLANTKEGLRVTLELSEDVPFSQYKNYIYDIPSAGEFYDFVKNRFFSSGETRSFSDMPSQFTRLSSATMWKSDKVIDVPENTPRINNDGLLIEPQRTNLFPNSVMTTGVGVIPTTLEVGEGNVVSAVRFPQGAIAYSYVIISNPNPCVISAYVQNSDNSKPEFAGEVATRVGVDFAFVAASAPLTPAGYTVLKHGDVYRVSSLSVQPTAPTGSNGIVKYATNSLKDVTATYRQIEAGGTLTSLIKSSGSPTTRAKETLVVPFTTGQTVTADKDAGVTMTIVDNNAVFEGHGYIRTIEVN